MLLLKLLENYLNIFCKFKGAWKLLKNEKFKKTPWIFYLNTHWTWKNILETIKEKNIESYLVQERLGKKMCRHYCKQTLREALFFFVGFPVAKTPKSTGNSAAHDSSVHEEHVSRLSITAMNGCWVCEVFLQFLDFSTFKNNKWLKKWTYLKVRINLSAKLWILIVNNNVFTKILIGLLPNRSKPRAYEAYVT